ncbi:hypothetical protein AVEN_162796-1 [Araneus ventricosus]|uniref:Uncharacterized protein n=1 Tax=Araneus ventricosus TaxID=182803 RepID=A0A4Y2C5P4_ARAVE|nr:hypothetical protein AVEN_162796-1 [Araneus ventricosus]
MENVIKFEVTDETSGEQNSIFIPESGSVNTVMEITNTELDQSAVDTEADNQQCMEISPSLEEKREDRVQSLFAPFSHHMRPDPEYIRLELEKSASDQEAATKLINDRYKLIMENSARRKEKEQKDKIKSAQISHNVGLLKTTQLSHYVDIEDIKKTTQLLHNMHLTPGSLAKDQSEEFSDNHLEKICWHNGLNRFIKLHYVEINTKADISNVDMLNTVTEHHGCRVEDALRHLRNEGGKKIIFSQASRKLGSAKCKKDTQIFCDEKEFVGSSFEDLLDERFESLYEI